MKKVMSLSLIVVFAAQCISCNDDGTGEKTRERTFLIKNESKPLKTQYAALGIGAWAVVSAVGLIGHKYVNRKK